MGKSEEYRANAVECERMAGICRNPGDKATRLQMAAHWLGMIPKSELSKTEQCDADARAEGTGQTSSKESH